jgi:integrase
MIKDPFMGRISDFLDQYQPESRYSYSTSVNLFLSYIFQFTRSKGQRITSEDRLKFETFAERYFLDSRDHEEDIINFSIWCSDKYAPLTCRRHIAVLKEFFSHNDVNFTRKQEKNIRNKIIDGGPVSEEADLTKNMIRAILNACDIRMKALILILITSGMRIGELATLRMSDIVFSDDGLYGVVTLRGVSRLRGTKLKNRHSRITFIGKEAVEVLKQWYEVRGKYLETSCKRSRGRWTVSNLDDGRIFPFGVPTLGQSLRVILKRVNLADMDEDTGRSLIHFHLFRKYFITTLTYSGIPEKFVDFYAGHLGKLDKAYQRQSKGQLTEIYLKGEPYLRIYDEGAEEIARQQNEIRDTKEKLRDMQIERLTDRARTEDAIKTMQARIAELQALIPIRDAVAQAKKKS